MANTHREDLNDIELAEAIKDLAAEEKWKTNTEIADQVDLSASWVGQLLRLLKLPTGVNLHTHAGGRNRGSLRRRNSKERNISRGNVWPASLGDGSCSSQCNQKQKQRTLIYKFSDCRFTTSGDVQEAPIGGSGGEMG